MGSAGHLRLHFSDPWTWVVNGLDFQPLDYGTLRVATATMGYKHRPLDMEEARRELTLAVNVARICASMLQPVVPRFAARDAWLDMMRSSIAELAPRFSMWISTAAKSKPSLP